MEIAPLQPEVQYFRPFAIASQYYIQNRGVSPAPGLRGPADQRCLSRLLRHDHAVSDRRGAAPIQPAEQTGASVRPPEPVRQSRVGSWGAGCRAARQRQYLLAGTSNLASATTNANGCTEMTSASTGTNRCMLMRFNWEHDWFNRPVRSVPPQRAAEPAGCWHSLRTHVQFRLPAWLVGAAGRPAQRAASPGAALRDIRQRVYSTVRFRGHDPWQRRQGRGRRRESDAASCPRSRLVVSTRPLVSTSLAMIAALLRMPEELL